MLKIAIAVGGPRRHARCVGRHDDSNPESGSNKAAELDPRRHFTTRFASYSKTPSDASTPGDCVWCDCVWSPPPPNVRGKRLNVPRHDVASQQIAAEPASRHVGTGSPAPLPRRGAVAAQSVGDRLKITSLRTCSE
jgi:hypothetical protein